MSNMSQEMRGRAKITASAVSVAISTASESSGALQAGGVYYVTSDEDCFFKQGASSLVLTTIESGNPLWARTYAGPFYHYCVETFRLLRVGAVLDDRLDGDGRV